MMQGTWLILLLAAVPLTGAVTSLQDMEKAIVGLDTKMRVVASKLHRHEARSRQVNEVTTQTLRAIVTQTAGQSRNVESIAVYMAKMESRLIKMEQALQNNDKKMTEILELLTTQGQQTAQPSDSGVSAQSVIDKITKVDKGINERLSGLMSEALTSRETVMAHLERQDDLVNDLANSMGTVSGLNERVQQTSQTLGDTEQRMALHNQNAEKILTEFSVGVSLLIDNAHKLGNDSRLVADDVGQLRRDIKDLEKTMDARQVELYTSHYETPDQNGLLEGLRKEIVESANITATEVGTLRAEIMEKDAAQHKQMESKVQKLREGQEQAFNMISESMAISEGLFDRVNQGYNDLRKEIQGLSNLEAVMVDTADSVLDTKRRLEYGVQQILLEVEAAVRAQGIKINGTFSSKFGHISQEILTNQSIALHNMTKSIEDEIAQVWRQIGVMYQTLSSSAQVLNKIDNKTTQYVNGTLESSAKVGGTVGDVSKRVGEVEENLNFLLGRLSLVVSEFNHMKSGIGQELDLMRNRFRDFGPGEGEGGPSGPPATHEDARKVPIE